MLNLRRSVLELFLDAQTPVLDRIRAVWSTKHHQFIARCEKQGRPEQVGSVFYCKDGYVIHPVPPTKGYYNRQGVFVCRASMPAANA
jgi:hypothetical protein